MDPTHCDALTRTFLGTPSRRAALRKTIGGVTTAAVAWLIAPPASPARKKRRNKKRPNCAVCPSPPPVPFCAGKNTCAQAAPVTCQDSGPDCFCYIRADNAAPYRGKSLFGMGLTCASCPGQMPCVILGGTCNDASFGFGCAPPCDDPL